MAIFARLGDILLPDVLLEVIGEALFKIISDLDEISDTENALESIS